MELRHLSHLVILLMHLCCFASSEVESSGNRKSQLDYPTNLNLGKGLVAPSIGNTSVPAMYMEGGTENNSTSTANVTTLKPTSLEIIKLPVNNTHLTLGLPAEETMHPWQVSGPDKNSTTKARKGVTTEPELSLESDPGLKDMCTCCENITTADQLFKCPCCKISMKALNVSVQSSTTPKIISSATNQPITKTNIDNTTPKIHTTMGLVNSKVNATTPNSTVENTETPSSSANITTKNVVPVPHRQKPNVTEDKPDLQVPAHEQDYVIPVVGIIFAIPLVIILGVLVYKKGADLWERRHYRRMDFLIDGIYNQ